MPPPSSPTAAIRSHHHRALLIEVLRAVANEAHRHAARDTTIASNRLSLIERAVHTPTTAPSVPWWRRLWPHPKAPALRTTPPRPYPMLAAFRVRAVLEPHLHADSLLHSMVTNVVLVAYLIDLLHAHALHDEARLLLRAALPALAENNRHMLVGVNPARPTGTPLLPAFAAPWPVANAPTTFPALWAALVQRGADPTWWQWPISDATAWETALHQDAAASRAPTGRIAGWGEEVAHRLADLVEGVQDLEFTDPDVARRRLSHALLDAVLKTPAVVALDDTIANAAVLTPHRRAVVTTAADVSLFATAHGLTTHGTVHGAATMWHATGCIPPVLVRPALPSAADPSAAARANRIARAAALLSLAAYHAHDQNIRVQDPPSAPQPARPRAVDHALNDPSLHAPQTPHGAVWDGAPALIPIGGNFRTERPDDAWARWVEHGGGEWSPSALVPQFQYDPPDAAERWTALWDVLLRCAHASRSAPTADQRAAVRKGLAALPHRTQGWPTAPDTAALSALLDRMDLADTANDPAAASPPPGRSASETHGASDRSAAPQADRPPPPVRRRM